jgi:hypothetical protein
MPQRYKKRKIAGKSYSVHRLAMEEHLGVKLGRDVVVHHENEDKLDNRIENLKVLTHAEHARLHNEKHPRVKPCAVCGRDFEPAPTKRARKVTCSRECFLARAKEIAQEHRAKLTPDDVREIRRRRAAGEPRKAIAESFGIDVTNVSMIALRKTWAHVE